MEPPVESSTAKRQCATLLVATHNEVWMATRSKREPYISHTVRILVSLVQTDPALHANPERLTWANDRWLYGISHLGRRISGSRKTVYWLRGPTVFGSLLVPILATGAANSAEAPFWRWATVVVSLIVALCTAIDQVVRPAARWRLVREARSALEAEGWAFLQRVGKYASSNHDERFQLFFTAVEAIWSEYERTYLSQVAHSQESPGTVTNELRARQGADA